MTDSTAAAVGSMVMTTPASRTASAADAAAVAPAWARDATAAGDGFNAAYIAARMTNKPPAEAAAAAHRLAGQVIRHRGALMPRAAAAVH